MVQDHLAGFLTLQEFVGIEQVSGHDLVPVEEVSIYAPVGESLLADTDALKYTVASQLVENQRPVDDTTSLDFVGDQATHEAGVGGVEVGHQ